jgi:glycosyltransferase involved in cell wall biosynthesis
VVIPTKNRSEALGKYALPSLERSEFRDFVCVVWDASDDDLTRAVVENGWGFEVIYFRASRPGSASQRNDAVKYVLGSDRGVKYFLFMDDDSELSEDALAGVVESFEKRDALIVNIPMKPLRPASFRPKASLALKRLLGMNRHGATAFLYNYGGEDEAAGHQAQWAGGNGMGVDVSVFRDLRVFFPEEFQRFGGYALGEDFAFSFYVSQKLGKNLINSLRGHFLHYSAGPARLNVGNMAAAKWYNFHLLFDALYGDGKLGRPPKWRFKLFMVAAAVKLLLRARSVNFLAVLRGVWSAKKAYKRYRAERGINSLMRED